MFLASNFLFTSSDSFAEGCVVQAQNTQKNEPTKIRCVELVYCEPAWGVSFELLTETKLIRKKMQNKIYYDVLNIAFVSIS